MILRILHSDLAEICDQYEGHIEKQDNDINEREILINELLPLVKDAYPEYDGPTSVDEVVPSDHFPIIH